MVRVGSFPLEGLGGEIDPEMRQLQSKLLFYSKKQDVINSRGKRGKQLPLLFELKRQAEKGLFPEENAERNK